MSGTKPTPKMAQAIELILGFMSWAIVAKALCMWGGPGDDGEKRSDTVLKFKSDSVELLSLGSVIPVPLPLSHNVEHATQVLKNPTMSWLHAAHRSEADFASPWIALG